MIDIVINNTKWRCPISWNEISIQKAVEIESTTSRLSQRVKQHIVQKKRAKLSGKSKKELSTVEERELAQFSCNILATLCGVPPAICDAIEPKQLSEFVETHLRQLIEGILSQPFFTPTGIDGFEWQGSWFVLPKTEFGHDGEPRPCAELSAEEFCSATDLYVANRVANSSRIIATMCRPQGECHSQKRVLERAEEMKSLPMSVVWEVFALLTQAHSKMSELYPECYSKRAPARSKSVNRITKNEASAQWQQIPIVVARGVPSEVKVAQRMNCYELMQILALRRTERVNNTKIDQE